MDDAPVPPPLEGRIAIVTDVGSGMRWTRWCRRTSDANADGKGVWSRHPDAGVKLRELAMSALRSDTPMQTDKLRLGASVKSTEAASAKPKSVEPSPSAAARPRRPCARRSMPLRQAKLGKGG